MKLLSRRDFAALAAVFLGQLSGVPFVNASDKKKAAIVCYSRSGNTLELAKMIQKETGAKLFTIEPEVPYAPAYGDMTYVARTEVRNNARRELKKPLPDLTDYSTVFVCSPYWWGSLSVPMSTFLKDEPLAGKKVFPVITSGSSSPHGAVERIKELCSKADVGQYFYAAGDEAASSGAKIKEWLKKIGF